MQWCGNVARSVQKARSGLRVYKKRGLITNVHLIYMYRKNVGQGVELMLEILLTGKH